MSLTFIAGLHVPFNTHLTFTPIPWPPPFSFRCVADQLSYLPYRRITGQGLRQQVWTKPWEVDGRESLVNPRSPDQNDRPYSQVDFEIVNMSSEMGWQTVDGEDPNLDILELYSHPEMVRTTSREISYETELDIRIKPTGGWWLSRAPSGLSTTTIVSPVRPPPLSPRLTSGSRRPWVRHTMTQSGASLLVGASAPRGRATPMTAECSRFRTRGQWRWAWSLVKLW